MSTERQVEELWKQKTIFRQRSGPLHGIQLPFFSIPVTAVRGIGRARAKKLGEAGFTTIHDLLVADEAKVDALRQHASLPDAVFQSLIDSANHCVNYFSPLITLQQRAAERRLVGTNNAMVDNMLLRSVDALVSGEHPLTLRGFLNLCTITEAAVLHEHLVAPINKRSLASFERVLADMRSEGLIAGPEVATVSAQWGDDPLSGVLHDMRILISDEPQGSGESSNLKTHAGDFSQVPLSVEFAMMYHQPSSSGVKLGLGGLRGAFDDILQSWSWALLSEVQATTIDNFEALEQMAKLVSATLQQRMVAVEAQRRGWHSYRDIGWYPFHLMNVPAAPRAIEIMKRLDNIHQEEVGRHLGYVGFGTIEVPMLTAILLSRCKARHQIPEEMIKLREEFTRLRESLSLYEARLANCRTLQDMRSLSADLGYAWKQILKKIRRRDTRLIRRMFDIVKSGSISGVVKAVLEEMLQWVEDRSDMGRLHGFVDIWKHASNIEDYSGAIERVFGETVSVTDWRRFRSFTSGLAEFGPEPTALWE